MDFNLMPWRQRQQHILRVKTYILLAGSVVLLMVLLTIYHLEMQRSIRVINAEINALQSSMLSTPKATMQEPVMPFSLPALLQSFEQVGLYGVCVASLALHGESLQVRGYANQVAGLLAFITYLQKNAKLPSLQLKQMQKDHKNNFITFQLVARY